MIQLGRNDACPCGSGKKYKKCCAQKSSAAQQSNVTQLLHGARYAYDAGDYLQALDLFEKAARLQSRDAFIQNNIAVVLMDLGRAADAERRCREALRLNPAFADAHNNLARALAAVGKRDEAIAEYLLAIKHSHDNALFRYNLGSLLQSIPGRLDEAERCYKDALQLQPDFSPAFSNLGALYLEKKDPLAAKKWLLKAHEVNPHLPQIMSNLGDASLQLKDYADAIDWCRRAISLNFSPAYINLGIALENSGNMDGAIEAYRKAVEELPRLTIASKNYIRALLLAGRLDDAYAWVTGPATDLYQLEKTLFPDFIHIFQQFADYRRLGIAWQIFRPFLESNEVEVGTLASVLVQLNYDDSLDEREIFKLHVKWGALISSKQKSSAIPVVRCAHNPSSEKIRVGYLSADFRAHSVAYFLRGIISEHNRDRFDISCYSNVSEPDHLTDFFKQQADRYVSVVDLTNAELADRIRSDGIDILVDLSAHTKGSRIAALSTRPAPLQISYLGYPNTTGADFIDYWITDDFANDAADTFHTERLLRLPECFLCFGEFENRSVEAAPAALRCGYVTFGSFNNLAKLSRTTVRLWSSILKRIPNSRLFIKSTLTDSPYAAENLRGEFEDHGIDPERLIFAAYARSREEHLDCYRNVDIALDPLPYTGTTTTCEALWMGVPVVTLAGKTHRQRTSFSILKNADLSELVTWSEDQYIDTAIRLAQDLKQLALLRQTVAAKIRSSILCKPRRFVDQYEAVLEWAWQRRAHGH